MTVLIEAFVLASSLTILAALIMWMSTRRSQNRRRLLLAKSLAVETELLFAVNKLLVVVSKAQMDRETENAWRYAYNLLQAVRSSRVAIRRMGGGEEQLSQYLSDLEWMKEEDGLFVVERLEVESENHPPDGKIAVNQ